MTFTNKSFSSAVVLFLMGFLFVCVWIYLISLFGKGTIASFANHTLDIKRAAWLCLDLLITTGAFLYPAFFFFKLIPKSIEYNNGNGSLVIRSYFLGSRRVQLNSGKILYKYETLSNGKANVIYVKKYGFIMILQERFCNFDKLLSLLVKH